jgi:tetratricopeptide (TPR) repeat protein
MMNIMKTQKSDTQSIKSRDFYENILIHNSAEDMVVDSLPEYMNAIFAIRKRYNELLFRGQADKDWDIKSSAVRFLEDSGQKTNVVDLKKYHKNLIDEVIRLRDAIEHKGLSLLAHLQHNEAKTNLIDYSRNPLVSLWFACGYKQGEKDGCVYFIEDRKLIPIYPVEKNDEIENFFERKDHDLYVFMPANVNRRIISQQSVFLTSPGATIDKNIHGKIIIPKDRKKDLVEELSLVGISHKTLFPDFTGMIEWFGHIHEEQKYKDFIQQAEEAMRNSDYGHAIALFNDAIVLCEKLYKGNIFYLADLHSCLAEAYFKSNAFQKAEEEYRRVLSIQEKVLRPDNPDLAETYSKIIESLRKQNKNKEAVEWERKADAIKKTDVSKEYISQPFDTTEKKTGNISPRLHKL